MRRREFLQVALSGAGAMLVGVSCGSPATRNMRASAEANGDFRPTHFLTITPDDRIRVGTIKAEMGQATHTTHAILVAEELGVDIGRIEVFNAVSGPEWGLLQVTGGSTSTPDAWDPVRTGAAAARTMLVAAAATGWQCPPGECKVDNGVVVHEKTGRKKRFGELVTGAAKLDIPTELTLKTKDEWTVIGKRHKRVDLMAKVTGAPVFGMDFAVKDMLKAVVLRPPVFGGEMVSFDAAEAKGMVGVVDVFEIEFGVAVVAQKYWQAKRAAAKVKVEWDLGKNARLDSKRLAESAERYSQGRGVNQREDGDLDEALAAEGVKTVGGVYQGPFLAHASMEPLNGAAHVTDDEVHIWSGNQSPTFILGNVARMVGVPKEKVFIHTTLMGGGFGRRSVIDFSVMAVAVSARLKRPVHVIWSREQDTQGGFYRPLMLARMTGAIDGDGKPVAFGAHAMSQSLFKLESLIPDFLPGFLTSQAIARAAGHMEYSASLPNILATEGLATMTYDIPNVRVDYSQIRVNVPVTFWRSVGHSVNAFATEGLMDEMAHAAGKDGFEFRRGLLSTDPRKLMVLEAAAELGQWGAPLDEGWGRGIAAHTSFGTYCALVVEAGVVDGKIKVRKVAAALDCGIVLNPDQVEAQIDSSIIFGLSAAISQRIDIVEGRVQQGNYHDYPALRMFEAPEISYRLIESEESPTGVGEPALPPVAPALAAALFQATGKRLRSLPLRDALKEVG